MSVPLSHVTKPKIKNNTPMIKMALVRLAEWEAGTAMDVDGINKMLLIRENKQTKDINVGNGYTNDCLRVNFFKTPCFMMLLGAKKKAAA
jgi:hypothetical protein